MADPCLCFDIMENRRLIDFFLLVVFGNNDSIDEVDVAPSSVTDNWLEYGLIDKIELRSLAQFDFRRGVDVNVEYIGRVIDFRGTV